MQRYDPGCGIFWLQCPKRMQTRRRVAIGRQNRWWRVKFQGTVDATEYTNLLEQSLFKVWLENTLPLSCVVHSFYCENQSIKIFEQEFQGKYIIKFFPNKNQSDDLLISLISLGLLLRSRIIVGSVILCKTECRYVFISQGIRYG